MFGINTVSSRIVFNLRFLNQIFFHQKDTDDIATGRNCESEALSEPFG